jgi:heme oxygenase
LITPHLKEAALSVRTQLRAVTADLHSKLDARLAPMVKDGDAGYARFLLCSATALLPVESTLEKANIEAILPDWPQRRRSDALRLDLQELLRPEPPILPAPEITSDAFQFGLVYVLEGSRLGARLILRDAQHTLSPAARSATRYLSHGQHLPLWPSFLMRLEQSPHVRRHIGQAAAGALAAFQLFLTATDDASEQSRTHA